MKPKYPLIAAAVTTTLVNTAHPLAVATDRCSALGETICAPEAPPPTDNPEHQPQRPLIERSRSQEAPPPPMPPGRGMTYAMAQEPPWPGYGAVFATLPQHGGAAVIDAITRAQETASERK